MLKTKKKSDLVKNHKFKFSWNVIYKDMHFSQLHND